MTSYVKLALTTCILTLSLLTQSAEAKRIVKIKCEQKTNGHYIYDEYEFEKLTKPNVPRGEDTRITAFQIGRENSDTGGILGICTVAIKR